MDAAGAADVPQHVVFFLPRPAGAGVAVPDAHPVCVPVGVGQL